MAWRFLPISLSSLPPPPTLFPATAIHAYPQLARHTTPPNPHSVPSNLCQLILQSPAPVKENIHQPRGLALCSSQFVEVGRDTKSISQLIKTENGIGGRAPGLSDIANMLHTGSSEKLTFICIDGIDTVCARTLREDP
ncbi:hypothetical protein L873DRAFT_1794322 [Choiromyces venosus 120613-1]|uniref:Uncharacterized protein n=1 Tax=Choiromyces venosus 120613-1 TaxID=1336337 RepID=A0A3N4J1Y6_9PEZI|nr:hypothetical protein L873DRAFT_1794322 [Choiromyces venosus 120613-1]